MQQQDLLTLLTGLTDSLLSKDEPSNLNSLKSTILPVLLNDLRSKVVATQNTANPALPVDLAILSPLHLEYLKDNQALNAVSTDFLSQTPEILKVLKIGPSAATYGSVQNKQVIPGSVQTAPSFGASIVHAFDLQNVSDNLKNWYKFFEHEEFVSVFLSTNNTTPVLMLPVSISYLELIFGATSSTDFQIGPGSVWILSSLLTASAPPNTYTGLTVSGGKLSFGQSVSLNNKSFALGAGDTCTVTLDLQQPVDASIALDKLGLDAKDSKVNMPASFSFSFSTPLANITNIADPSWDLYGSSNTFHHDLLQAALYNPVYNAIFISFKASTPSFTISTCESPAFTIRGTAPIELSYWELPVQSIDITKPNNAQGTGAITVVCSAGLEVRWKALRGNWATLRLPLISATPGIVQVADIFASGTSSRQHLTLWHNELSGFASAIDLNYTDYFSLVYQSFQVGTELLSTSVHFKANIDRPLCATGSPVEVHGSSGLSFMLFQAKRTIFLLYDLNILQDNHPVHIGKKMTSVPQQALALSNALLSVTPAAQFILYGLLDSNEKFTNARLLLSFGLFDLVPALPDPYASSFKLTRNRSYYNSDHPFNQNDLQSLPLASVKELLVATVTWAEKLSVKVPQVVDLSFWLSALPGSGGLVYAGNLPGSTNSSPDVSDAGGNSNAPAAFYSVYEPNPDKEWGRYVERLSSYDIAMLDVSTNADLMGVSLATTQIRAQSEGSVAKYVPVVNSIETDFMQISGIDLAIQGKYVRAFTLPEITWEPVNNLTPPAQPSLDPPTGWLLFPDDGGPTQIFNNSEEFVTVAPLKVSSFIVDSYNKAQNGSELITAGLFTLPFGIHSFAVFNTPVTHPEGYVPARLQIAPQTFDLTPAKPKNPKPKILSSGLQIIATGQQEPPPSDPAMTSSSSFEGFTLQLRNLLDFNGVPTNTSILGFDVDTIFNSAFGPPTFRQDGVPVERIDFSGYGASMFSHWQDPTASIAAPSQAKFEVFVGRTALEVIQVRSLLYPWGVRVVRTITMTRAASAIIYRVDSGWRAETDGLYDFSYKDKNGTVIDNPYEIHPGVVKGVYNVKNIIENDLQPFITSWERQASELYINPDSQIQQPVPAGGITEEVYLTPVYFDADVLLDHVDQGGKNNKVPSKKMLGYIQLTPRGEPISAELFDLLLFTQGGSLGGPVDCLIDIGSSGQKMRVHRVDVGMSLTDTGQTYAFAGAARGTVILPKDGSWSMVEHKLITDSITSVSNNAPIPLIRKGVLNKDGTSDYPFEKLRFANTIDLIKAPDNSTIDYGFVQNTGTQKVLYQQPAYLENTAALLSKDNAFPKARFADAFHLVGSTGIFPKPGEMPPMVFNNCTLKIIETGFQTLTTDLTNTLTQNLPDPFYFVQSKNVNLYISYDQTIDNLNYSIDSDKSDWASSAKNITLNIDLLEFKKLVYIDGNVNSVSGSDTAFEQPALKFGPDLKPVADILEVLNQLSGDINYKDLANKAMNIAMSNSGDNFEYKFHADKEIATIQFPSAVEDSPATPLRLTAGLKVGAYFNEALAITTDPSTLLPSAGAYFEFDGGLQVMCVSLAVATIYAVGQVTVRVSADTNSGPELYLKAGFGVELMVGLPVIGNVSVTYMVGIEMTLSSTVLQVSAFMLYRGEASLIGGMVDITISIEAAGTIKKTDAVVAPLPLQDAHTDLTAQITFALDISVFLVINIDFSKSWSETKQIA